MVSSEAGRLPSARRPHDAPVDGLVDAMHQRAAGLGDAGIEQVGAHRSRGMDVEQQDQQRRHQRAAAHAGHPDQEADGETGQDEQGLGWSRTGPFLVGQ